MTLSEFASRYAAPFTLRFFPGGVNDRPPWRAAQSAHYYTSDSDRLVFQKTDTDDRSCEGWGDTPEEAVDALVATIVGEAERSAAYHRKHIVEAEEKARKIAATLLGPP